MPELALIRFVAENQGLIAGNEFLGQYTLPVLCMNRGNILKSKMTVLIFMCNLSLTKRLFDIPNSCLHYRYVKKKNLYINIYILK